MQNNTNTLGTGRPWPEADKPIEIGAPNSLVRYIKSLHPNITQLRVRVAFDFSEPKIGILVMMALSDSPRTITQTQYHEDGTITLTIGEPNDSHILLIEQFTEN